MTEIVKAYILLFIAIIAETISTSCLKLSDQFTKFWPSFFVVTGMISCIYLLSMVFKIMPVGITNAIWSAVSIILVTIVGIVYYKEPCDFPTILGIALIIAGIIIINVCSDIRVG